MFLFFLAACKQAASLGGSCNIECCEGDLCNYVNTTAVNSSKPEVPGSNTNLVKAFLEVTTEQQAGCGSCDQKIRGLYPRARLA